MFYPFPLYEPLVNPPPISNNFSFKCHRRDSAPNTKDQALVYAVNDISFHPVHGTFSTCGLFSRSILMLRSRALSPGSDGTIHFWDKDARTRLKSKSLNSLRCIHIEFTYTVSLRPRSRPYLCHRFQPQRHHLRICRLVRLVKGTLWHDSGTSE